MSNAQKSPQDVVFWQPRFANCFIWAVATQLKWGGYVCFRQSNYGWWPHAVWSLDRRTWYEYSRRDKTYQAWWKALGLILFRGEVMIIDREVL